MLRKFLPIIALGGALVACSPAQEAAWFAWHSEDPEPAAEWAAYECGELCTNDTNRNGVVEPDIGSTAPQYDGDSQDDAENGQVSGTASGTCGQWYGTAMDAGFTDGEWSTVATLMSRESNCQPGAYNPSGASGLMQIMPGWADDCGGSPSDLFNPWFNLHCAVHVKNVQGWGAWSTY